MYARSPLSVPGAFRQQVAELNKCVEEVEEKRQKAIRKFSRFKKGKSYIYPREDEDKYADDNYYRRRLEECYRKYKRLELIRQTAK